MANPAIDFAHQQFVNSLETVPHVILDAVVIQPLFPEVARKNDLLENFNQLDHVFPRGQRVRFEVLQRHVNGSVGRHDPVRD